MQWPCQILTHCYCVIFKRGEEGARKLYADYNLDVIKNASMSENSAYVTDSNEKMLHIDIHTNP